MQKTNTTFRQIDLKKYLIAFYETDNHTPDIIAWELKQKKYESIVTFVETRKVTAVSGTHIEMEIHLQSATSDVADLIRCAAEESARGWDQFASAFAEKIA
jgi:hypothetical protein